MAKGKVEYTQPEEEILDEEEGVISSEEDYKVSDIQLIPIEIEGRTPIIINRFMPTNDTGKIKGSGPAVMGNPEEWRERTHVDRNGRVGFTSNGIIRCWSNGGASIKAPGGSRSTFKAIIPSCVMVLSEDDDLIIPILFKEKNYTLEDIAKNGTNNPGVPHINAQTVFQQGSGIVRYRTCVPPGWRMRFNAHIFSLVDFKGLLNSLHVAGEKKGLGDYRPSSPKKPGPHGIFRVIRFGDLLK